MENRRKFKRLPMRGFLTCSAQFDQGDATSAEAEDGYPMGCIAVRESDGLALDAGDKIDGIRFDLGELQSVTLHGHVAHRMSLGEIGGCGVEFDDCEAPTLDLLDTFVQSKLDEFGLNALSS